MAALLTFGGCATGPQLPAAASASAPVPTSTATAAATSATPGAAPLAEAAVEDAALAAGASSRSASAQDAGTGAGIAAAPARPRLDPQQDAERADLWQRVRDGLRIPDLDGELVHKWEAWYASRPDYVQRMTERGSRYLFHIVEEVERRGMPVDLALLPFVESAFNPQATSSARASGMWQFMPGTGKDFELRQNLFRDDRRDVLASTRAALDFLQRLYERFGDWQLALAAYNWGPGNVQRAIDRNLRVGLPTDFANLQRMPQETREYVPKLQAVKNIVRQPDAFGLQLPVLGDHPYFLSVAIERDIDVALAARLAGLTTEEFQQLNPQLNKPVILAAGTPQVLLPYDAANRFIRRLAVQPGPYASWTAWIAPRTVKPAEAARLTGMGESQLREVNHIPPRMLVKAGSTLLVPRSARSDIDVPEHVADHAAIALAPEGPKLRRVAFKAGRKGDSVAAVARRYRVAPAQVADWNRVAAAARFTPGQTIVVMVPVRAKARTQVAASAHRAPARAGATRRPAKAAARVRVAQR
ncbi:MAG: transglycosylase SLT domain-containing protein [Burkholderiales bacterium]|nr:transglycosylase SLT domain-containing protein [Burkholderiales bacterium]